MNQIRLWKRLATQIKSSRFFHAQKKGSDKMRELQEVRQTIKELENEREETDKKIQQLDNQVKRILKQDKEKERRQRTKRLIERGAILESAIENAVGFSNDEIQQLVQFAFQNEQVQAKIKEILQEKVLEQNTEEIP